MKKIITLISNDLRHIFRDKTLLFFLVLPFFLLLFVRQFVPVITEKYPIVADYHFIIMMSAAVQTAIMFGFIISFVILEEKDEQVLQAIRVLPISPFYFMMYRLLFASVFSALGAFLVINLGSIAHPGLFNSLLLSLLYGLTAPFITLVIATYANNKVEGMAIFKGVDLLLILPLLSFFIDSPLKYGFSIFPTFWVYGLYDACLRGGNIAFFMLAGLAVYGAVLSALFFQFKKRVFDR